MKTSEAVLSPAIIASYDYALPVLAFSIPFLVSGPQILTGTLVNCFLFLSARYSSRQSRLFVAAAPSIGALLNGLVFGKFTPYLAYFLPFIWIGNSILMIAFSGIKKGSILSKILASSLLKAAWLFVFAAIFLRIGLVPKIFLTAMGLLQLATAVMGGLLFLLMSRFIPSYERHR